MSLYRMDYAIKLYRVRCWVVGDGDGAVTLSRLIYNVLPFYHLLFSGCFLIVNLLLMMMMMDKLCL